MDNKEIEANKKKVYNELKKGEPFFYLKSNGCLFFGFRMEYDETLDEIEVYMTKDYTPFPTRFLKKCRVSTFPALCECGHDKAFHEMFDDGRCIHGLKIYENGKTIIKEMCKCKKFTNEAKGDNGMNQVKLGHNFELMNKDGEYLELGCLYLHESINFNTKKIDHYNLRIKLLGHTNKFTVKEITSLSQKCVEEHKGGKDDN